MSGHLNFRRVDANVVWGYRVYEAFPRALHEHRRTILSLWPGFKDYLVWADIENCSVTEGD